MLSKTEIEFLKNPQKFDADYSRVMRHRIKIKAEEFRTQIALLQGFGALGVNGLSVTENCNGVTEFSNGEKSLNRVAFLERGKDVVRSPGFEPGIISLEGQIPQLDCRCDKQGFLEYLDSKNYEKQYRRNILRHLELYIGIIREPMDIIRASSNLTDGQKHNLNRALSALLRFYELKGIDPNYLNALRKAIPRDTDFIDL